MASNLTKSLDLVRSYRTHNNPQWLPLWQSIVHRVYEASTRASRRLKPYGVGKAWVHAGGVKEVEMTALAYLTYAEDLRRVAPQIEFLRLSESSGLVETLCKTPALGHITALSLRGNNLTCDDALRLSKSPHLAQLRWLDLQDNHIQNDGLRHLAVSQGLGQLLYVALDGNPCDDPLDLSFRDGLSGRLTDFETTPWGRELESLVAEPPLKWLHSAQYFGHLYPPSMSDALF